MENDRTALGPSARGAPSLGEAEHDGQAARNAALRRYAILDTPPELAFDDIARLAAQICQTPVAAISFVDEVRQWFKASVGLNLRQTPRDGSFCTHAIEQRGLMIVPDARADERYAECPMVVGEPYIRFYAGAVLETSDGQAVGTLCVWDREPRQLSQTQQEALSSLARQVVAQLDLRLALAEQARTIDQLATAKEQLRNSQEELADFVEKGGVGLHWIGVDGRILWANQAELETLGYQREEYVGHAIAEFHTDQHVVLDLLNRLSHGEELHSYPARLRAKDGSIKHVLISSNVHWHDGQFVHTRCFTRDVTDRQTAVERLNLYREIFANSSDGIAIIDTEGRYLEQNAAHRALTGYSDAELRGRTPTIHLDPAVFQQIARELITQGTWRGETVSHTKAGQDVLIEMSAFTVRDHAGDPVCFVGLKRDITQRKAAEQALRDSEARYRQIFETAVDGIITILENGAIESANPSAERMFGYTMAEMAGRNVNMLMPAPFSDEHDGYLARYLRTGERRIIGHGREVIGRRKDGSTFPMDLAVSELWLGGRRVFLGMTRDVTERRNVELEREQLLDAERTARAEAQQANRAKDQFLAVLSHELRTPLTPVLTTVQLLEAETGLVPETREALAMIRRNVELETRLIDDMLDVTRIANGKIELQPSTANVHDKLRNVLAICDKDIQAKGLRLKVDLLAARHVIRADPPRLQQVLWNLVKNAVKFTPAGGTISIRTFDDDGSSQLGIEVRDTGIGIDQAMLPRIFEAFEQGGRDVTRRFGGLGLGLSISQTLVELHGGTLHAHSDGPGRGAVFTVRLPVAQGPGQAAAHTPVVGTAAPSLAGCRILLVEDHLDTARAMARLLGGTGYDVRIADSVAAALQIARAEPFDLLISDIGLPDGSGLDLMHQLAAISPVRGIALSGFGRDEDVQRSRQAGFSAHLTKPINMEQLKATIRQIVDQA
jgi:PAS domain S-box-containing protein